MDVMGDCLETMVTVEVMLEEAARSTKEDY